MVNNIYTLIGMLSISAFVSAASVEPTYAVDCYGQQETIIPGSPQFYAPVIDWKKTTIAVGDQYECHERVRFVKGPDKSVVELVANAMNHELMRTRLHPNSLIREGAGGGFFGMIVHNLKLLQPELAAHLQLVALDRCIRKNPKHSPDIVYILPTTVDASYAIHGLDITNAKHIAKLQQLAQCNGAHHTALYLTLSLSRFKSTCDGKYKLIHH